jgi:hypothetical protein
MVEVMYIFYLPSYIEKIPGGAHNKKDMRTMGWEPNRGRNILRVGKDWSKCL